MVRRPNGSTVHRNLTLSRSPALAHAAFPTKPQQETQAQQPAAHRPSRRCQPPSSARQPPVARRNWPRSTTRPPANLPTPARHRETARRTQPATACRSPLPPRRAHRATASIATAKWIAQGSNGSSTTTITPQPICTRSRPSRSASQPIGNCIVVSPSSSADANSTATSLVMPCDIAKSGSSDSAIVSNNAKNPVPITSAGICGNTWRQLPCAACSSFGRLRRLADAGEQRQRQQEDRAANQEAPVREVGDLAHQHRTRPSGIA